MKRIASFFAAAFLALAALPAVATQTGTARSISALYDSFCDQCGLPKNGALRDLIASVVVGPTAVTGLTIDASPIGGTTPAAGAFTTLSATGVITASAGAANAVSLNFGNAGTGFYKSGTNSVGYSSNGTAQWIIDSSGGITAQGNQNLTLGTFSGFVTPTITGAAGAAPKLVLHGSGTGAIQVAGVQTTVPTCSSNCGTSPSVAGSDIAGVVTMGASGSPASGWVVTFNGTWAAAPSCIVQSALSTMVVGKMPIAVQTATTTLTVTTNGTAPGTSDKYAYVCIGVQ